MAQMRPFPAPFMGLLWDETIGLRVITGLFTFSSINYIKCNV